VGLIITVTGLDHVLSVDNSNYVAMQKGLNETVSGMGTAFYTTFFGALLGGVVLKVLCAEVKKSATLLVADVLRFGELFMAPQCTLSSSEALADLESRVITLGGQLAMLGMGLTSITDIIDSKQADLAAGLSDLLATLEHTFEDTNRKADERMADLIAVTDERLSSLTNAVQQTKQDSLRQVNEYPIDLTDPLGHPITQTREETAQQLGAIASDLSDKFSLMSALLAALAQPEEEPETPGE
jgi:ElaB/YqjD/DUF883 family membrane-anchored ribosome-binding protein